MSKLQEFQETAPYMGTDELEYWMGVYDERKHNICLRMERQGYDPYNYEKNERLAQKNYERASKIYTVLWKEKQKRVMKQDEAFRAVIDHCRENKVSLGVVAQ